MKSLKFFLILFIAAIAPLQAKTIVVLGDSLSAAYGIDPQKGWVHLLAEKLKKEGNANVNIINLSTSGDTTSNGLAKIEHGLKKYQPEVIIIELGANDGLLGLAIPYIKTNLETMIKISQKAGAKVLLLATTIPSNRGQKYLEQFKEIYLTLAKTYQIPVVPMFLEGVAGQDNLMQADGLHPNELAQPIILNNVWPQFKAVLETQNKT